MKSQGDITGRTGDWEDLQPRGEGGANWQVSEARTAGLEDVPPLPPLAHIVRYHTEIWLKLGL